MVGRYQAVPSGATNGSTAAIVGPVDARHTHEQYIGVWHTMMAGLR